MSEDKNFSKWNGSDNEESALQLSDILAMFTSHKWAYVIFTALCLFIALFYLYRTPKTWSRTAKVIVDESAENSTLRDLASFSASSARSRYYASSANVYNEMEAFSSPDIMQTGFCIRVEISCAGSSKFCLFILVEYLNNSFKV